MISTRRGFTATLAAALTAAPSARALAAGAGTPSQQEYGVALGGPIISDFERRRRRRDGRDWVKGYTQGELDAAQQKYDLVFPPDLVALLREKRPAIGYDWRTDDKEIREMLAWPLEGLLFDVENNAIWWPEWGERPVGAGARREVVSQVVAAAPKLIPLVSHRYLPADPHEAGNPVFSVYQSDVVYYGADLADYFTREFGDPRRPLPAHIKRIAFWSELVERHG
ncbi:MAG TPA: SMI1/KNR4 family protein [Caulobacteraceae bacterium]|nr:SMI1/KNR4 family protein [Caulobacteraceae bacterium]